MFTNDITLNAAGQVPSGANAQRTFSLISIEGAKSIRRDPSSTLTAPRVLTISHDERKGKGYNYTGTSLKVSHTDPDANGKPFQFDAGFYLNIPKGHDVADPVALVTDLVGQLVHFLRIEGNITKLLNQES